MSNRSIIYGSLFLLLLFTFFAVLQANWKIIGISWIAFSAMALAIPLGVRAANKNNLTSLVAGYGLASGAMITSAAIFLVPEAIGYHPIYGGIGIAIGIMAGFAIHTLNHDLTHSSIPTDPVVLELTSHSLADGIIVGMVYALMPELGLLLGLAIISHKAPAGYASARRLGLQGKSASLILLPAMATGLTALPVGLLSLSINPTLKALIFGFATGVFFHVAIDFLPECELGGKIHRETELDHADHHQLDKYRRWAVLNTFVGGLIVFIAWYVAYGVTVG